MLARDLLREDAAHGVSEPYDRVAPNVRLVAEEYAELAAAAGMRPRMKSPTNSVYATSRTHRY